MNNEQTKQAIASLKSLSDNYECGEVLFGRDHSEAIKCLESYLTEEIDFSKWVGLQCLDIRWGHRVKILAYSKIKKETFTLYFIEANAVHNRDCSDFKLDPEALQQWHKIKDGELPDWILKYKDTHKIILCWHNGTAGIQCVKETLSAYDAEKFYLVPRD